MLEWFFVTLFLGILVLLGFAWKPLLIIGLPLFLAAVGFSFIQAGRGASRARFTIKPRTWWKEMKMRLTTGLLFLIQPITRLYGRVEYSLTSIRSLGLSDLLPPWEQSFSRWFEQWQSPETYLEAIEKKLRLESPLVLRGGVFDAWDLEVRGGMLGSARLLMGIEEFGGGKQLVRYRIWPQFSRGGLLFSLAWLSFSMLALIDGAFVSGLVLGLLGSITAARALFESTTQVSLMRNKLLVSQPWSAGPWTAMEKTDLDLA
jgi:hypothetical protein